MWTIFTKKSGPKGEAPTSRKPVKSFCSECKYMQSGFKSVLKDDVFHINFIPNCSGTTDWSYSCNHPELTEKEYSKDDYMKRGTGKVTTIRYQGCSVLNEKNDCKYFEKAPESD